MCADGWHRAFEAKPENRLLFPAAVGGSGLRFILRPMSAASDLSTGTAYPSLSRRDQGPPNLPSTAGPPFAYISPHMPFGQGRPVPKAFGACDGQKKSPEAPYAPHLPFGYPQQSRRAARAGLRAADGAAGNMDYESRPRRYGRQDIWQTSSMAMSAQANGQAAYR